jgi:hypothetical protein
MPPACLGLTRFNSVQRQFQHVVDHMMQADRRDRISAFKDVTVTLDRLRGEDTATVCPELAPLLRGPMLRAIARRTKSLFHRIAARVSLASIGR